MPFPALASTLVLALATTGLAQPARFNCNGEYTGDQSICDNLTPGGSGVDSTGFKVDGYTPVNSVCVEDPNQPALLYCGYVGAACDPTATGIDSNCDNGYCDPATSTCAGALGEMCSGDDSSCLGYIYCTGFDGNPTASDTCGGIGAYCDIAPARRYPIGSSQWLPSTAYVCQSGYCSSDTLECTPKSLLGEDCSADGDFQCEVGTCVDGTCQLGPSQVPVRHRERRSKLCPAPFAACHMANGGFECVDTSSSIEQCGACASDGGVDCTALPGVDAVGCVAGQCEIWACAEGLVHDATTSSCVELK